MDKSDLSLETIQQRFADALIDVDLVEHALPLLAAATSPLESRLAFYRGNLTSIWYSALANAYPVLLQLVGVDFFEKMARAYGRAFPSRLGDLTQFGGDLPRFLITAPMTAQYPYFVDVAILEWKVHRAYYAADANALTLPSLISGTGENMQSVRLNLHPATQLHESNNASVSVWLAHQNIQDETETFNLTENSYAIVTRNAWRASVLPLSQTAFQALHALSQQSTLGEALEIALASDAQFDIASALNVWFSAGAFSGYEVCKE